jgi:hypothetical protein
VVGVDGRADGIDELDDQFGHVVAGRRLPTENHRARGDWIVAIVLDAVVERNDVQEVEQLALVLVDALDLHVEHRIGAHGHTCSLVDERNQLPFASVLDLAPAGTEVSVFRERLELLQLVFVRQAGLADLAGDEEGQLRVAEREPAAWRHAVGHVEEFLRPHLVEVPQHRLLEQFGVQGGNAIDRV